MVTAAVAVVVDQQRTVFDVFLVVEWTLYAFLLTSLLLLSLVMWTVNTNTFTTAAATISMYSSADRMSFRDAASRQAVGISSRKKQREYTLERYNSPMRRNNNTQCMNWNTRSADPYTLNTLWTPMVHFALALVAVFVDFIFYNFFFFLRFFAACECIKFQFLLFASTPTQLFHMCVRCWWACWWAEYVYLLYLLILSANQPKRKEIAEQQLFQQHDSTDWTGFSYHEIVVHRYTRTPAICTKHLLAEEFFSSQFLSFVWFVILWNLS